MKKQQWLEIKVELEMIDSARSRVVNVKSYRTEADVHITDMSSLSGLAWSVMDIGLLGLLRCMAIIGWTHGPSLASLISINSIYINNAVIGKSSAQSP